MVGKTLPGLKVRISRWSIREQIAERLAELVLAGLLRVGDELPAERELAATLNVSRESLRGALQLLAERGVLGIGHGTRTRVLSAPTTSASERHLDLRMIPGMTDEAVLDARFALEPELARRAAERLDAAALARLERMLEAQSAMLGDPVRFQIADSEFHHAIFQEADSVVMASFAGEAYAHAYRFRREVMEWEHGIEVAIEHHTRLVAAMRRRDPAAAALAMHEHLQSIRHLLTRIHARTTGAGGSEMNAA